MKASDWLLELDAATDAGTSTLRYSSGGYTSRPGDDPANAHYPARLSGLAPLTRNMFGDGRTLGGGALEMADAVLVNVNGDLDPLKDYVVDGRPFVLRRLRSSRDPLSAAVKVMTGSAEAIEGDRAMETLRVRFYDRRRDIDVPIETATYGGTTNSGVDGGADGTEDQKGQLKPNVFGRCLSVPGVLVDPYNLIIQVANGPVHAIVAHDGGVPLVPAGDHPDLAALTQADGAPGQYATCLSLGLWRPFGSFNGRPAFVWTADVTEGATAGDRCAARVVERILGKIGETGLDVASFDALAGLCPQEVGIYLDSETSCLSAAQRVLDSIGGYLVANVDGDFEVGRFEAPGEPAATIRQSDVLTASQGDVIGYVANPDTEGNVPAHRVVITFGRNWHVHSDSDLGGCVTFSDPTRAERLKKEWREARAEDAAVKARHKLSKGVAVETLLVERADADAEAARRLDLYGQNRDVIRIMLDIDKPSARQLGETVTLELDRFGYAAGRAMRIIGRTDDFANDRVTLTLWG